MFYDVELLKRRGGKFGVIWQVANNQLQSSGKGARRDLRVVAGVKLSQSCEDVAKYVSQQVWPNNPKQRLSLYLSAMLVHGITQIHYQQVKLLHAGVQQLSAHCASRAAERRQRNPNHEVLDLSSGSFHLLAAPSFKRSLAEAEFQTLDAVSSALSRTADNQQSSLQSETFEELEDQLVADRHIHEPLNLENAFEQIGRRVRQSHTAEKEDITMQEVEPVANQMQQLEQEMLGEDASFGPLPNGSLFDIPVPMDIVYDEGLPEPLRVDQTMEPPQAEPPQEVNKGDVRQQQDPRQMQIELAPVDVQPRNPRRGRRLIIDAETTLPADQMKDQIANISDIVLQESPMDRFRYTASKPLVAAVLLSRPSRYHLGEMPRNLLTRRMITRPITDDERVRVQQEEEQRQFQVPHVGGPFDGLELLPAVQQPQAPATADEPVIVLGNVELMDVDEPLVSVAAPPIEPSFPSNITFTMQGEPETLRHHSNEASYSGSLSVNASRAELSGSERSAAHGIELAAEKVPLETVDEASVEASTISSRLTGARSMDVTGRSSRPGAGSLPSGDAPEEANRRTQWVSRKKKRSGLEDVPEDPETQSTLSTGTYPREVPNEDRVPASPSRLIPGPTRRTSVSVRESNELLSRIRNLLYHGPLTFRKLAPSATTDRSTASSLFLSLLGLAKDGKVNLVQQHTLLIPYPDIYISLMN